MQYATLWKQLSSLQMCLMLLWQTLGNHQHLISPNLFTAQDRWKTEKAIYCCYYGSHGPDCVSLPQSDNYGIINRAKMPLAAVRVPTFVWILYGDVLMAHYRLPYESPALSRSGHYLLFLLAVLSLCRNACTSINLDISPLFLPLAGQPGQSECVCNSDVTWMHDSYNHEDNTKTELCKSQNNNRHDFEVLKMAFNFWFTGNCSWLLYARNHLQYIIELDQVCAVGAHEH